MKMTFGTDPELACFTKEGGYIDPKLAMKEDDQKEFNEYYLATTRREDREWDREPMLHRRKWPFHYEEGGMEFHPKPADTPEEGVAAFKEVLDFMRPKLKKGVKLGVMTLNDVRATMGGHIHIGGPKLEYADCYRVCAGVAYLQILADSTAREYRRKHVYGCIYGMRTPHTKAGLNTYEFRSPTADWLARPLLMETTYKFVAELVEKLPKVMTTFFAVPDFEMNIMNYEAMTYMPKTYDFSANMFQGLRKFLTEEGSITVELLDIIDDFSKRLVRERAGRKRPIVEVKI